MVYPWLCLMAAMVMLLLINYVIYHYYADPHESYCLAVTTVVLSLTVSVLCTLLIPVDIYVISAGDITSEALHVTISQDHVRTGYFTLFSSLLFLAFVLVPHAYFYGEERGGGDFDDKIDRSLCCSAAKSTGFFVGFVMVLLTIGLNFRPGHTETLDVASGFSEEHAVRWMNDLLDVQHSGLNALSFAIACLTSIGVFGWVFYTAYGMASMPFDWLRGKQTPTEQRVGLEESIAVIREKYRAIQTKYATREDGSLDLAQVKAFDRKELNRLTREHKSLMQHNYRLQELEQKAGAVIPKLLACLVPFRWMIGVAMMSISLLVASSLFLTLLDRLLHSPCGLSCGYTLKERAIFNPADEIFLWLSKIFPLDFIVLATIVLYIFATTISGVVGLGIPSVFGFHMYTLRPRKSLPQALLVLCNLMAYILLALCMALLTIAPNYTSFGSQTMTGENGSVGWCSMERQESKAACQVSVISMFFTRIAIAMPFFSVAYFFANWAFIAMFCMVFARCLLCTERRPFLDHMEPHCEEEELGLLSAMPS